MARQQPDELFTPPNLLKSKVGGGGMPVLDTAAIERAEAALEELKGEFAGWTADDVKRLVAARQAYAAAPDAANRGAMLRAAHDLKGQAATFDFPLIARVAGSLSKLLYDLTPEAELPLGLVDAHVAAVHVIYRDKVNDMSDKVTVVLIQELERQVNEVLEPAA
jgi:chemotaxis protein histidine kinase CheA